MEDNSSEISNKKILITGGCGFIGSFLIEHFYKKNKVTVFDNGRRDAFSFLDQSVKNKIILIKGDIRDQKSVKKIVKNQDIIIHLAAIAGASSYEKDPLLTLEVNLFGTANLLKSLIGKKFEKLIIFSTSEVYGPSAVNVKEDDLTCIGPTSQGRWSYAISKITSDHLAIAYFKKYNLPITIVRPFNVYGPRQVGEGAVNNMLTSAISENKIFVSGDGLQKRAWCYISDLVKAVELICKNNTQGECFNIGNPNSYLSILDLAKKIQKMQKNSKIIFTEKRQVEIIKRKPNIKKARNIINFSPVIRLDEGIKQTFDWWIKNISRF